MVCPEMEYNQILCRALPSQLSRKLPLSKFGVTKSYGICGFGHSFLDPHIEEIMEIIGTIKLSSWSWLWSPLSGIATSIRGSFKLGDFQVFSYCPWPLKIALLIDFAYVAAFWFAFQSLLPSWVLCRLEDDQEYHCQVGWFRDRFGHDAWPFLVFSLQE